MDNNTDIDKIFSEGFSEEQFPYNPASWDAMSDMLDKDEKRSRWWLWLRWSLLILVLAGAAMYFLSSRTSTSIATTIESVEVADSKINKASVDRESASRQADIVVDRAAETNLEEAIPAAVEVQDLQTTVVNNPPRKRNTPVVSTITTIVDLPAGSDHEAETSETEVVDQMAIADQSVSGTVEANTAASDESMIEMRDEVAVTTQSLHIDQLAPKMIVASVATRSLDVPTYTSIVRPMIEVIKPKRWELEITTGAELSSLGGMESMPKAGSRGGLRLGYYLSDKWSLHAGLIYSNKIFAGSGDQFEDRSIFTDVAPETMEGKSAFLEIPITVRYHWQSARRVSQFVEVGLTNFNHRSEWYGFEYKPEDEQPNLMKEIPARSVNKMGLGAMRFAYSLDIGIAPSTTVGVVPYVQVPLRGIGAGNVSIYNTGLELALRHRL